MLNVSNFDSIESIEAYPLAYKKLNNRAVYRKQPENFKVQENLSFVPLGHGDHVFLYIEKTNCNSDWLARELAERYQLKYSDVGYAGRKDRFAITKQWFSLHIPGSKEPSFNDRVHPDFTVLKQTRHTHKLRKGEIKENHFQIQLTDFEGDEDAFFNRVKRLSISGFPNYFGPQRFGHGGKNVDKALEMLSGKVRITDRNKRSIYLSAARSFMYNQLLKARLEQNCWLNYAVGDCLWDHKNQQLVSADFMAQMSEEECQKLINEGTWSISAALLGDTKPFFDTDTLTLSQAIEKKIIETHQELASGIKNSRVEQHQRSMRSFAQNLSYRKNEQGLLLTFSLTTGVYATSLLRELI